MSQFEWYTRAVHEFIVQKIDRAIPFDNLLEIHYIKYVKKIVDPAFMYFSLDQRAFKYSIWKINYRKYGNILDGALYCDEIPPAMDAISEAEYYKNNGFSAENKRKVAFFNHVHSIFYIKAVIFHLIAFLETVFQIKNNNFFDRKSMVIEQFIGFLQFLWIAHSANGERKPKILFKMQRTVDRKEWRLKFFIEGDYVFSLHQVLYTRCSVHQHNIGECLRMK